MKATLVLLASIATVAHAEAGSAHADDSVRLVAQPVRAPVAPDRVMPVAPFVPAETPEVAGEIAVGPDRAAALWLDALDVIVVHGEDIELARVVGAGPTRAVLAERGSPAGTGVTSIAQPPGRGDVWMIWARRPTTIHVERPVARAGRAIWETTQRALFAWVDAGGARPAIPVVEGAAVAALRIDADAATGAALEMDDAPLRAAVRAWRKARIVAELATIRPFVQPQLAVASLLDGPEVTIPDPAAAVGAADPAPYHRTAQRAIDLELAGPGALRLEARAVLPAPHGGTSNAAELPDVAIAITSHGQTLGRQTVAAAYATVPDATPVPAAFPIRQPLVSREGDLLSERAAITVPLFPGTHRYRIVLEGGALAVRATVARHRPRMADAIAADDVDELLADARGAVRGTSLAARRLGALLEDARGSDATTLAAGTELDVGRWNLARRDEHAWTYALEVARRTRDADAVRALYATVPGAPPPSLVPELVALLPRATPQARMRNWPLAATLMAARAEPTDPTIGAAARARWRTGEWMPLRPSLAEGTDLPPARRWLVEAEPQPLATPRAWKRGDLAALVPGRARRVIAEPSFLDPARAALLDVYVEASANSAIAITVDGKRFETLAIDAIERVQLAVAPGEHTVTLDRGRRGWVSQRPVAAVEVHERARVQALWPSGSRVRYALPAVDVPVEITLRASTRARVVIRGDVGPATELVVGTMGVDPRAHPLDATRAGGEARFVMWPARGARTLWIEGEDVVAAVASRRERRIAADGRPGAPRETSNLLDRVATASRTLAQRPDDATALASRANDLLDLGEPSLAREDLVRLLHVTSRPPAALEEELFARLDDATEPTHVVLAVPATEPVLVGPALAVLATNKQPTRAAIDARAALARGDTLAAARLLAGASDRWQVAFEAVDLLARVLGDRTAPPGTYALAYGLAARVRTAIDHPRVRRALVLAAAQTGWDTLGSVETSAGHEAMLSTQPILPVAPSVLVREALVASPWPARAGHTLTAGVAGVLDITLPAATAIRAQVYCVRVRAAELTRAAATAPCTLTVRTDNGIANAVDAPLGRLTEVSLPLGAGRHVIEVALASEGDAASVRFTSARALTGITDDVDGTHAIRIENKTKLFVASASMPITTSVQGPTTLWVQARATSGARHAEVTASSRAGVVRATMTLAEDRDRDARADLPLGSPSDTFLVLPAAATYQIAVSPDRGELVARLARRDERRGKPPRAAVAWYVAAPTETAAFAIALPPAIGTIGAARVEEPRPGRLGTLSIDVRAEQDMRGDEDVASTEPGNFVEAGIAWRRALAPRRVWLGIRAGVRSREGTATIATGESELAVEDLPFGSSLTLAGAGFTQPFSDGRAWHLRGRARLGFRWELSDTLALRPAVSAGASYLNTAPSTAMVATARLDPDVFSAYRETHRRDGTAALALTWQPLQDFVGELRATATTNADFASLDFAGAGATVRMLAPLPLVGDTLIVAGYRPNYRLADDDRPNGYWRHDLVARIEHTLWTTTHGRFVLSAWDEYTTKNALGIGLRFDLVRHRGLADFAPADAPFASLVDERAYAPLETP